jgi:hypothetical protein
VNVNYQLRLATLEDEPVLRDLIARSIRELGTNDYTPAQIEAALLGAFGVDTALIRDQTYFAIVTDEGEIVGCGGWSRRRTLFGSDTREVRDDSWLDPATEAARARASAVGTLRVRSDAGRLQTIRVDGDAAGQTVV